MFAVENGLDPRDVLLAIDHRGRIVAYVRLTYQGPIRTLTGWTWYAYSGDERVGFVSTYDHDRWNASLDENAPAELARTFFSFHAAKSALEKVYLRLALFD